MWPHPVAGRDRHAGSVPSPDQSLAGAGRPPSEHRRSGPHDLGPTACKPETVSYGWPTGMWRSLVSAPALGAGGRGFESRHPDQLFRMCCQNRSQGDSWCLSPHVGRRGSVSAHVGSHLCTGMTSSCLSNLRLVRLPHTPWARRRLITRSGRLAACRRSHLEREGQIAPCAEFAGFCRRQSLLADRSDPAVTSRACPR
jgi:hypothetical protein